MGHRIGPGNIRCLPEKMGCLAFAIVIIMTTEDIKYFRNVHVLENFEALPTLHELYRAQKGMQTMIILSHISSLVSGVEQRV